MDICALPISSPKVIKSVEGKYGPLRIVDMYETIFIIQSLIIEESIDVSKNK